MGMGEEYKHQVPIAYAAYMRKTKIVAYLLYHGASPDERNTGQFAGSAVEIAKRLGDTKMLAVLESKGKSTLDT